LSLAQNIANRVKISVAAATLSWTMGATSAFAQESTGMPQLKPEVFEPQIIWLAISFVFLYLVMAKKALPQVAKTLDERETRIATDLDEAESHRLESVELEAAYEKTLAEAKAKAGGNLAVAREELKQGLEARKVIVNSEISAKINAAEAEVNQAKNEALDDLENMAVDVCRSIVSKLTGETVDKKTAKKAVKAKLNAAMN
jgi:F-type H+-transporting ATPase subunit b